MNANFKYAERVAILATLDPASVAVSTVNTAWVPAANFHRFVVELQTGVLGAAATVDCKFRQATDAAGTGAKDVTGKALTQIVKATGDNKQALLELLADDLDTNNGYAYIGVQVAVGGAASLLSASVKGFAPRFATAAAFNQAAVVQTV